MPAPKTGITLFDIDIGEKFAFNYAPNEVYRLMGWKGEDTALVRAQRAGAEDENANPYCDVFRKP